MNSSDRIELFGEKTEREAARVRESKKPQKHVGALVFFERYYANKFKSRVFRAFLGAAGGLSVATALLISGCEDLTVIIVGIIVALALVPAVFVLTFVVDLLLALLCALCETFVAFYNRKLIPANRGTVQRRVKSREVKAS